MRFNWGTAIALVYTIFATCTTGFVVFAVRHPVELVSDDYYVSSLRHDEKRAAVENADALGVTVLAVEADQIVVAIPAPHASDAKGEVSVYRPSDVSADRTWALAVDSSGSQRISTRGLTPGRWIARVSWTSGGRRFYNEVPATLP